MSRKLFCSQLHFLLPLYCCHVYHVFYINSFRTHEPHVVTTVLHSSVCVSENTSVLGRTPYLCFPLTLMYLTLQAAYFTINPF